MSRVQYQSLIQDSDRWDRVSLRPDDIVISTAVKCGTTWMQRICSLLVLQSAELYEPLDSISPWIDMLSAPIDDVVAHIEAQQHRRFLKSHTPADGLPWDPAVTYITVMRDPRDQALSWDNHLAHFDMLSFIALRDTNVGLDDVADVLAKGPPAWPDSPAERFWMWVASGDDLRTCLATTLQHFGGFWERRDEPNVIVLRYEDLAADLEGQMRWLADRLGIDVPDDLWPALVHAATFEQMRARSGEMTPEAPKALWDDTSNFFSHGRPGRWRELLDDDGLERYAAAVASFGAPPELVEYIHAHSPLPHA